MPWSISPRFANGSRTYSLLFSQVFKGDGSSFAHVALDTAHSATTTAMPTSGKINQSNFNVLAFIHFQTCNPRRKEGIYPFMLFTANPFAYSSGFAGSNV